MLNGTPLYLMLFGPLLSTLGLLYWLRSGNGADMVDGGTGNDWMEGGQRDDTFFGGDGKDQLWGYGAGSDATNQDRNCIDGEVGDNTLDRRAIHLLKRVAANGIFRIAA